MKLTIRRASLPSPAACTKPPPRLCYHVSTAVARDLAGDDDQARDLRLNEIADDAVSIGAELLVTHDGRAVALVAPQGAITLPEVSAPEAPASPALAAAISAWIDDAIAFGALHPRGGDAFRATSSKQPRATVAEVRSIVSDRIAAGSTRATDAQAERWYDAADQLAEGIPTSPPESVLEPAIVDAFVRTFDRAGRAGLLRPAEARADVARALRTIEESAEARGLEHDWTETLKSANEALS